MTVKSAPEFQGTDRYQVLRSLGSGTFGSVYEAFDRVRGIRVALKVPHESHALALLLFKQEFRALAEVSHPNLVTLFELVGEGDRWFFTMERLEGVDCQSYLRPDQARPYGSALPSSLYLPSHPSSDELATPGYPPGPPAPPRPQPSAPPDVEQVRRIFRQITEGLLALHRAGLVHRDLKPSNVLVTPEGRVAILDFGLALDLENATEMGETGKGVGTPAYCAPEQVEGRPASAAGDWYSMGIMLYQALVGQLPFTGTPLDMVRAKRNLDALPPSLLVPGLPGDLESLCLDLLVRDPGQRPVGEEILARLTREPPPESLSPQTVPLGRVHEIRILLEALRTFRTGQPVLACVHGASGMGKSMLLRHFLKLARRKEPRLVLFRARCDPEESLPYKAVDGLVDDLSQYLRRLAPADQAALLPDWTPALARLFPVLNQVPAVAQWPVTAPEGQDPMAFRRGAFLALRELLARVARRQPLVLVVEDLQWADGDSAPLLMELLRAPAPPFLLVIAHDQGERDGLPILRDLNQPGLAAECRQVDVALAPLGEEQAVRAARAMLRVSGPDVEVRALWAARLSEGHPFFLAELVHALRLAPTLSLDRPKGMKAFLLHRLESLDGSSRGIVELLCIAGHPLPWRTLMKAYGAGPEAEALLPALRNGHHLKVRASAHGERVVEAYHEGIRRLVQETLPPDRVVEGHQRLAEALEALVPPPHPQLASHYAAAGLSDRASAHALEAAWQARENLAFHQEARFLDLALSHLPATHPDLPALAVRRAEALAWAGRSCDAARAFLRACPLHSGPEVLSQKRRAAEEFFRCGHMEEAVRTLTEVLASVQEPYPHSLSAAILRHLWSRGRLALRGLRPSPPPTAPVPDVVLNRIDILWAAAMGLGPVDVLRTLDFQARHLRLALDRGEPFRLIRGLAHEAVYRALLGNRSLTVTRRILETARALGTGSQDPEIQGRLGLAEGIAALLQGRWLAGARLLDEAELLLREKGVGLSYERFTAQYQALVAWSVVGELGLVAKRYQPLTMEAMERGDLLALCNFRSTMGYQVFLARNDPDGTAHMLDTTEAEWGAGNFHTISYHLLISRVNLFLYLGRATEARATMEAAWSRLRWTGFLRPQVFRITARELLARTLLARAALTRPGSLERRRLLLRVRWMASKLRREHTGYGEALALKLLAGCDRLSRDRTDAAAHLQQAQEAFRTCDMRLHAEVCSHILAQWIEDDTLHASSEAWIRSQGIQAPEAWCRMHLPV